MASSEGEASDRIAWLVLGFGLVMPWWLPFLTQPVLTFYKEWLFALALGLAGLGLAGASGDLRMLRGHPLVVAAAGLLAALAAQALLQSGVWQRALLTAACVGFFVFTIALGIVLRRRRGDEAVRWLARCLVIAALGSCVLAALQLFSVTMPFPFVLARAAARLSANLAQANHFADLLSLGAVGVAFLHASGRLGIGPAAVTMIVLLIFSVLSGSRMVWAYMALLAVLGAICRLRGSEPARRRFGVALLCTAAAYVVIAPLLAASGALETLGVPSPEKRMTSADGQESTRQRLWYWRAGIDAAAQHPMLGVGPGRFAGHAHELAMRTVDIPPAAADAQAHNLFIHLAAEHGVPVALLAFAAVAVWLVVSWRRMSHRVEGMAALAMAGVILIHANLEQSLWYLYFLGVLGLIAGLLAGASASGASERPPAAERSAPVPARTMSFASFAVVVAAIVAYLLFDRVEKAMQVAVAQVQSGVAPQPSPALTARLNATPAWSPYVDYAELIALITALPTAANAHALATRCDRAVRIGPTAHLLARCATAYQVAGMDERASYFADSLCRIYPEAVGVLIQSMQFVETASPAAAELRSRCVERVQ